MNTKILGNLGERIAKIYLQMNGYEILKCNYTTKYGEIDIIARKDNYLHFVEVKTRSKHTQIEAREAIDEIKEKHIWNTTKYYLYKNNIENYGIEFDAIEVYVEKDQWIINMIPQSIEK